VDGAAMELAPAECVPLLRPATPPSRSVPPWRGGRERYRIEVKACPVVFSPKGRDLSVSLGNWLLTEEEMARVVDEIATNITRATGVPIRLLED
jgi:hypothetical protein